MSCDLLQSTTCCEKIGLSQLVYHLLLQLGNFAVGGLHLLPSQSCRLQQAKVVVCVKRFRSVAVCVCEAFLKENVVLGRLSETVVNMLS